MLDGSVTRQQHWGPERNWVLSELWHSWSAGDSADPDAYRRSLEDRLRASATDSGLDLGWLRRRHVFMRVLHRLAANQPDEWVLKGGFAVELRRPGLARTTLDIDLTLRQRMAGDVVESRVRAPLVRALSADVDGDFFQFAVGPGTPLANDTHGRAAWRFTVDSILAGRRSSSSIWILSSDPRSLSASRHYVACRHCCAPMMRRNGRRFR